MLQLVDLAVSREASTNTREIPTDDLSDSHLLTGLELQHAKSLAGDGGNTAIETILADPRASVIAASYDRDVGSALNAQGAAGGQEGGLPADLRKTLANGLELHDAVKQLLAQKFTSIIMLPPEQLKHDDALVGYGLDSMLAAEFRGFIFQNLGFDVPFLTLLSNRSSIDSLAGLVVEHLQGKTKEGT